MNDIGALITHPPSEGIEYRKIDGEAGKLNGIKVRTLYTGICGTDRGIVKGALKFAYSPQGSIFRFLVMNVSGRWNHLTLPYLKRVILWYQ
ncbi:MAG: hypothetical protein AMDU2_EPLC00006G0607 [Thermoplasmatales archaeon E-plasma]|nr:MAG: hypothetical protein AMDU2_EPLC00006G0607 [Thermoplasmatales archaeon E-plasma]